MGSYAQQRGSIPTPLPAWLLEVPLTALAYLLRERPTGSG